MIWFDGRPCRASSICAQSGGLQAVHGEQAVDKQAIAARRRNTAGRGMRAGDKTGLLEVGHHVADRRWRQVEAGKFRQRP